MVLGDTESLPTILGPGLTGAELKPGADLSGKNFAGTQLFEQDLSGANFDNADFHGATIQECNLTGASFQNARLSGAKFIDNIILDANFTNATITDYYGGLYSSQLIQTRSFREKNLHGVRLTRSTLGDVTDLKGFDLRNATIAGGGDFRDVEFDGAQIGGATFEAQVDFEQLRKTVEVSKGRFPAKYHAWFDANLSNLDLRGASLSSQTGIVFNLSDAKIDECNIHLKSNDAKAVIESTWSYKQGRLRSCGLSGCDLSGISFDNMILDHVYFTSVNLTDASFRNTVIVWSYLGLREATLTAEQLRETYNAKHGHLSEFRNLPDQLKVDLEVGN